MVNRIGNFKLYRWKDGKRSLDLRVDHPGKTGWDIRAPKLAHGWVCGFIGRYGGSHTIFSYRKVKAA